jgi:hypothetical protein
MSAMAIFKSQPANSLEWGRFAFNRFHRLNVVGTVIYVTGIPFEVGVRSGGDQLRCNLQPSIPERRPIEPLLSTSTGSPATMDCHHVQHL